MNIPRAQQRGQQTLPDETPAEGRLTRRPPRPSHHHQRDLEEPTREDGKAERRLPLGHPRHPGKQLPVFQRRRDDQECRFNKFLTALQKGPNVKSLGCIESPKLKQVGPDSPQNKAPDKVVRFGKVRISLKLGGLEYSRTFFLASSLQWDFHVGIFFVVALINIFSLSHFS